MDRAQTAQRAEVTAAVAALRITDARVQLVTDSRLVSDGVSRIASGASPVEWRHADLWEVLAGPIRAGRFRARWVPAHKTAEEYRAARRPESDRLGNAAADQAAGGAAAARAPPPDVVAQRRRQLEDLGQAQRVLAFVELAALRANHEPRGNGRPRVRRTWAGIRRGARTVARRSESAPTAARQQAAPQPAGPPPPPLHDLERDGELLRCRACSQSARQSRWGALARSRCPSNAAGPAVENADAVTWRRVPHQTVEAGPSVQCTRCRGQVPADRRAAFVGRRCPAWLAGPAGGPEAPGGAIPPGGDWGAWFFALAGRPAAGQGHAARCRSLPASRAHRAAAPDSGMGGRRAPVAGLAWRPHVVAMGPRLFACLACGRAAASRDQLCASPCSGWVPVLPARVAALLLLGDALQGCGGDAAELAAAAARRRGQLPAVPD